MLAGIKTEPRSFPKQVQVPEDIQRRYVGTFVLNPLIAIKIKSEQGRLFAAVTGQPYYRVYPESKRFGDIE